MMNKVLRGGCLNACESGKVWSSCAESDGSIAFGLSEVVQPGDEGEYEVDGYSCSGV